MRWAADRLRSALLGDEIIDVSYRSRPEVRDQLIGATVTSCESVGKNILVGFSNGTWLRNHMMMYGKWRVYPRADFDAGKARAPRRSTAYRSSRRPDTSDTGDVRRDSRVRLVLSTDAVSAVQFNGPVIEFSTSDPRCGEDIRRLGPDALRDDFDRAEAARRLRERGDRTLADLLLDQSFVAGVGNKYKAEILFTLSMDPFRLTSSLTEDEQERLLDEIPRLLRAAYAGGGRTRRVPGGHPRDRNGSLWVYGRAGRPCHRCGTIVRSDVRRSARRTYYCPACQPVAG